MFNFNHHRYLIQVLTTSSKSFNKNSFIIICQCGANLKFPKIMFKIAGHTSHLG